MILTGVILLKAAVPVYMLLVDTIASIWQKAILNGSDSEKKKSVKGMLKCVYKTLVCITYNSIIFYRDMSLEA